MDSTEYHDANDTTEETTRKEETEADTSVQRSTGFQGGFGSSSLKECIELLNTTTKIAPAPLDSGVGNSADPQQSAILGEPVADGAAAYGGWILHHVRTGVGECALTINART